MTPMQRQYYKAALMKNVASLKGGGVGLNNVLMNLRKACNHPYLVGWPLGRRRLL